MRVIEAGGTPREIGRATGEALREEIARHLTFFDRHGPPTETDRLRRAGLLEAVRRDLPEAAEEMEGTAEGAGVPLERILLLNLELYGNAYDTDGCTNIGFAGGPDGPIWGKNNDGAEADPAERLPVCCRKITPARGIPTVTFTFAGWLGLGDGMNAEGLATGHSSVGSVFQQSDDHVQVRLWAHAGLLRCRTAGDFARHMASRPLHGKGYAWVVVDRAGATRSLEAACPLVQVRRSARPDDHLHCVNLYQLPELAEADRRPPEKRGLIRDRWAMLDRKLEEGGAFDLAHMQSLLRNHETPSVCRHGGANASFTEYSMIGLSAQGRVLYCQGYPCEHEYREITL